MKKSALRQSFTVLLLVAVVGWAIANIRQAAAIGKGRNTAAASPTEIEDVKQVSQAMGDAMVAADIDKLSQIFADDWASISDSGKIITRDTLLDDIRSGKHKLVSYKLGPIDVQVFGNVAVAHGRVTEKRTHDGKDTSGEFVWMDLLRKRAGKWVVVRSDGARID